METPEIPYSCQTLDASGNLKQRMYHLVMYNISEIQKGIQAYHAGMNYSLLHRDDQDFKRWAWYDKTVIILNGGTSNNRMLDGFEDKRGTMEKAVYELKANLIPCATFQEPDLNDSTSAIAFLVDERVWDKETYPDPVIEIRYPEIPYEEQFQPLLVGAYGKKIAFLRTWLRQFRLA